MERSSAAWLAAWIVDYLLNSAWQAPLVLLFALLAARLVSRLGSAAALHRMWLWALAVAVALPAFHFDAWPAIGWRHAAAAAAGSVEATILPGGTLAGAILRLSPAVMIVLLALYMAVTLYFAGRIARGLWRTETLRRRACAPSLSEPLERRWETLCLRLGVARARLRISPAVSGPAVVGRRTVLLPAEFIGRIQAEDLDAALAHELAHLRRGDFLKNIAYAALTLPVAYHPCVRLLRRRVEDSRESVCDAIAAEALEGGRSYVRSLLRLAMAIPAGLRGRMPAAVGIFEGNSLERRVKVMMDREKQLRGAWRWAAVTAVLLLAGAVVAGLAGTHLTVQAAESGPAQAHIVLHVSASVLQGNLVKHPIPKYPAEAKAHHNTVDGAVILGLTVNAQGEPTDIHVVKSLRKDYDESAIDAVRQWRWKPYLLNGKPTSVQSKVEITFRLAGHAGPSS